jgi:hypothetical protein
LEEKEEEEEEEEEEVGVCRQSPGLAWFLAYIRYDG